MRARLVLVPILAVAAFVAGCSTDSGSSTPTTPATTTPAANGVADLSVDQILAKANEALGKVSSFHMKGETIDGDSKTTVDFKRSGENAHGIFTSGGDQIEYLKVGDDIYMKGVETFLGDTLAPAVVAAIKGKYVRLDTTKPQFAELVKDFNTDQLLKPGGTATKGDTKTINGIPAIGLVDSKDNGVVYIATVGEPLPLRLEGADVGVIEFTYNESFTFSAPPASEVVDSSVLG